MEKTQINKIRNEKEEVTTDNAEIQRIIRDYYEQQYVNKMDNLKEMNRYLGKFNLLRLNQEEIKILNKPITSTEIKTVIKNLPKNKSQMASQVNSIKCFEKSYPSQTLPKIAEEGTLPNSFYEATIILTPKPDKENHKKRKLQSIPLMNIRSKNPQQNSSKHNSATH